MVVRLHDVSHRFGKRWVLARLTLALSEGKTTLLTGENGAGKTTLLRLLATAMAPTRGRLEVFGSSLPADLASVRARIGIVTHENYLYGALSAWENLMLVARLRGFPRGQERVLRLEGLLQHVGLGSHAHRSVGGFSAGMKRRLCFARLLLCQPALALLDEPFAQLDPDGVRLVEALIQELQEKNTTIVLSTHDVDRGLCIADFHMALAAGRLRGSIEEVR